MKKISIFLLFAAAFASCKKDNKTPQYDLSGTWTLSSLSTNGNVSTAADYPCIANDKLVFGAGNSATVSWNNSGTCWVNSQHTSSFSATDGQALTFTRQGNNLTLPPASSAASAGHGTVITVNGKLQLTIKDTVILNTPNATGTYYNSNTYVKQ